MRLCNTQYLTSTSSWPKSLYAFSEVMYCWRYGFASTSLLRVSGVHLGCSCTGEESDRSACSRTDADITYLEKPHSTNGILTVQSEAVIDARRHNNQIVLLNLHFVSAVQPPRNGASGRTFMRIHRESSFDLTSKYPEPERIYLISSSSCRCSS